MVVCLSNQDKILSYVSNDNNFVPLNIFYFTHGNIYSGEQEITTILKKFLYVAINVKNIEDECLAKLCFYWKALCLIEQEMATCELFNNTHKFLTIIIVLCCLI